MPTQIRDHGKATWMSTGGRRKIDHLVPLGTNDPAIAARAQRKTLCGKTERAVWTPVIPGELVKCLACQKGAAKRNMEIVAPGEPA